MLYCVEYFCKQTKGSHVKTTHCLACCYIVAEKRYFQSTNVTSCNLKLVVGQKSKDKLSQLLNDVVAWLKHEQITEDGELNVAQ